jgi:subtilisin family serine protease
VAPGHRLVSDSSKKTTLFNEFPDWRYTGNGQAQFIRLSGTSMSAGVVSGIAALVIEAFQTAECRRDA